MKLESLLDVADKPTTCAEGQMFREALRHAIEGWRQAMEDWEHNLKMLEPETEKHTTREDMRLRRRWLKVELGKIEGRGK